MAALINLKLDGTETGATAGQKINDAMVKVDAVEASISPASIKTIYESNPTVEVFSTAEKTKLSTIDGSHFKGVHVDIAALEVANPAATAEDGSYAYTKASPTDAEVMVLLDGGAWVEQTSGGTGSAMTGAQIKSLYEANADTEVFTTVEKTKLGALNPYEWDVATTYPINTLVVKDGTSYVSLTDNTGKDPLTEKSDWRKILDYSLIIDTYTPKTVGVGKDFELLNDALKWAETLIFINYGSVSFTLDEGTHLVGTGGINQDEWCYYLFAKANITIQGNRHKETTTFIAHDPASLDDGSNECAYFVGYESVLYFRNLTFEPTKSGWAHDNANDFTTVYDGTLLGIYDVTIGNIKKPLNCFSFSSVKSLHLTVKDCTKPIEAVLGYINLASPTFTNNTQDTNIPLNEIQNDGSFISDDTVPLTQKGALESRTTGNEVGILNMVQISQVDYDAMTPPRPADTMYVIVG